MIVSQTKRAGADPFYLGKLPDELDACTEAISQALAEVDILITTGGVSVGDFDLMPMVYSQIGANLLFNKIKMRPGSVTTAAEYQGKLLFGLSGNPSVSFVKKMFERTNSRQRDGNGKVNFGRKTRIVRMFPI